MDNGPRYLPAALLIGGLVINLIFFNSLLALSGTLPPPTDLAWGLVVGNILPFVLLAWLAWRHLHGWETLERRARVQRACSLLGASLLVFGLTLYGFSTVDDDAQGAIGLIFLPFLNVAALLIGYIMGWLGGLFVGLAQKSPK
jgi:hypothetical protein